MPFTNPDFPGQRFNDIKELEEAIKKRQQVEGQIAEREDEITHVTATILPASKEILESRLALLEGQVSRLSRALSEAQPKEAALNKDKLPVGMVLKGESKGNSYTLEILREGYLCSTGVVTQTLSAAAEEVSGNRRSGWAFWTDGDGNPIGEITGRFKKHELADPFGAT
jgi:hypothetical protein